MSSKQGQKLDVNKCLVLGMRDIGHGHSATRRLLASLGLPKPLSHFSWAQYTKEWYEHSIDNCEDSMKNAARELRKQVKQSRDECVEDRQDKYDIGRTENVVRTVRK